MDESMEEHVTRETVRRRLSRGECVYGPFLKIPTSASVEAIGLSGFDFCIIDLEHGPFTFERAEDMVRAARVSGIGPVIRTYDDRASTLVRALDTGCDGIIVPGVSSRSEAEDVVAATRFHPQGSRGMDPCARAARYGVVPMSEYLAHANGEVMVGVMVEGTKGLKNVPEILKVEGIDLFFVGPYDLSQSVGLPGQVRAPEVRDRVVEIVNAVASAGAAVGIYADTPEDAHRWRDSGVQFVAIGVDVRILVEGCRTLVDSLVCGSGTVPGSPT
jgi:4-hydroxy-2-oxoheptanedioate aldolase